MHALNMVRKRNKTKYLVMCDFDPGITCDYMILHCEDCRAFKMDPCHLQQRKTKKYNLLFSLHLLFPLSSRERRITSELIRSVHNVSLDGRVNHPFHFMPGMVLLIKLFFHDHHDFSHDPFSQNIAPHQKWNEWRKKSDCNLTWITAKFPGGAVN